MGQIDSGQPNNERTTDFLAPGSQDWISGPQIQGVGRVDTSYPCSVVISERSFLVIYEDNIREYEADIDNPTSDDGWQDSTRWPHLQTIRKNGWPGCAKISQKVVIAGGGHPGWYSGPPLRSTEILDLATRTVQYAGDLNTARSFFSIITITTGGSEKTFALGGYEGNASSLDSVEELDPDTLTWNTVPAKLAEIRFVFGAVALPRSLVCPA